MKIEKISTGTRARGWRSRDGGRVASRRTNDNHFTSERHISGGCGPVCTFGDW
jgi:hypothetical protein